MPSPPVKLRLHKLWLAVGVMAIAAVTALSLTPVPQVVPLYPGVDKVQHFIIYALLMSWFAQIYHSRPQARAIAGGLFLLGVSLEFAQRQTGYRAFEYNDMLANGAGVVVALLLVRGRAAQLLYSLEARLIAD